MADNAAGSAQGSSGISLVAFCTALSTSVVIFGVQTGLFLGLRLKLARVFKPKTYLVPERERTDPPPDSPWGMVANLFKVKEREIIKKCGLDSYFFLRYLQTLLIIFIPMACIIIPILVPLNYVDGRNQDISSNTSESNPNEVTGLDTLAWGNVKPTNTNRYWAHLVLALATIGWVCTVFFYELRVYIKVRQDWLTTAEHRLRASATTVLVSGIPEKWLNEVSLRGLFDVFPGGIRNVWLTRDLRELLDKISDRDRVHAMLEAAETQLIRDVKRKAIKKRKQEEKAERKASKASRMTKAERAERQKQEDEAARKRAEAGQGVSSGDHQDVPHDVHDVLQEANSPMPERSSGAFGISNLTNGFTKITKGIGKTGQGLLGGVVNFADEDVVAAKGFQAMGPPQTSTSATPPQTRDGLHVRLPEEKEPPSPSTAPDRSPLSHQEPVMGSAAARGHKYNPSAVSQDSMLRKEEGIELKPFGNTTRKATNLNDMYTHEDVGWWQFWKHIT